MSRVRSRDVGRANHILVSSRIRIERGSEQSPGFDVDAIANALHVRLPDHDLDLLGLRIPAYKASTDVKRMWDWVNGVQTRYRNKRAILLGDLNVAPEGRARCRAARDGFAALVRDWRHVAPTEGASYFARRQGKVFPQSIDHLFITGELATNAPPRYVYRTESRRLVNDGASYDRNGFYRTTRRYLQKWV